MDGDDGNKLDTFLYVVNNTKGQPCILANMSINFMIPYEKARIKYKKVSRVSIDWKLMLNNINKYFYLLRKIKISMFQMMLRYKAIVHL